MNLLYYSVRAERLQFLNYIVNHHTKPRYCCSTKTECQIRLFFNFEKITNLS